jgi:SAM-dependent methyltransferase
MDEQTNAAERHRWNDEYWTSVWPKREQLTNAVTPTLLDHLHLAAGERVLDIGSGGGTTAIAAGRLVDDGAVVGADISAPLAEFARRRVADTGAGNVSFVVVDVQQEDIPGGPFDAALSQFGVMFFDEPVVAFGNIRRQLAPGGRLAFACWQGPEHNPWFVGPVLAPYLPSPPPLAAGKSPTGPFSLSDADRVRTILGEAGWSDIDRSAYDVVVSVDRDAIVDDGQLAFLGVPTEAFEQARRSVEEHLERLRGRDGRLDAPLSFQIYTARA